MFYYINEFGEIDKNRKEPRLDEENLDFAVSAALLVSASNEAHPVVLSPTMSSSYQNPVSNQSISMSSQVQMQLSQILEGAELEQRDIETISLFLQGQYGILCWIGYINF